MNWNSIRKNVVLSEKNKRKEKGFWDVLQHREACRYYASYCL